MLRGEALALFISECCGPHITSHAVEERERERDAYLLRDDLLSRSAKIDDKHVIPATHNTTESKTQKERRRSEQGPLSVTSAE